MFGPFPNIKPQLVVKPDIAARTPTANIREARAHGGERDAGSKKLGKKKNTVVSIL
ncbi:hypothetical protein J6590_067703, partial [Homalodisca vitripennis]